MVDDLQVTLSTPVVQPGSPVTVEVRVVGDSGSVARVEAAAREYGWYGTFSRDPDGVFRLRTTVPWEAYPGTYRVAVYATDGAGRVLKEVTVPVRVA